MKALLTFTLLTGAAFLFLVYEDFRREGDELQAWAIAAGLIFTLLLFALALLFTGHLFNLMLE